MSAYGGVNVKDNSVGQYEVYVEIVSVCML